MPRAPWQASLRSVLFRRLYYLWYSPSKWLAGFLLVLPGYEAYSLFLVLSGGMVRPLFVGAPTYEWLEACSLACSLALVLPEEVARSSALVLSYEAGSFSLIWY